MPEDEAAITTNHLRKVYKNGFVAVDSLSLTVARGQIFGFLGPNGAGKTTTINMLLGNVFPTSGTAAILGAPIGNMKVRARLGFLPEKFQFHDFLSAAEFLDLHGRLYGMKRDVLKRRVPEVLDLVGLLSRSKNKIREFSKGMQQRVGLAQAILNDPELVILDEPTSALDPLGRRDVRDIVKHLRDQGKTILLNSHLLSEIELTCDEIAIMKSGKVVRQGRIDDLLAAPSKVQMRIVNLTPELEESLRKLSRTMTKGVDPEMIEIGIADEDEIPSVVEAVVRANGRLMSLIPRRETLEDLFIRIVEDKSA
jgi:ABC-2 type transport system ATP-binding protein